MNRAEFVKALAVETELTQKKANEVIGAAFDIIVEQVAAGESVDFVGFGSFVSTEMKEREGKNPKTKESITIPGRLSPKFKPGKTFKDLVAGKK